jgi:hypothetical protein
MTRQRAAARLYDGSGKVAVRVGRAFVPAGRPVAATIRVGVGLWAAPHLLNLLHQQPLWAAVGACAWCIAAWRATAPPAAEGAPEPAPEATDDSEQPDETTDFLTKLHQLLPGPDSRIHVAQVAEHLYDDPAATARVRDLCAAAGVTITRGVRVTGRDVSTGIHQRDLPPLPDPSPADPVAVVAAGQSEQQQQQRGARIVPDPDGGPHQWRVEWDDQTTREAS